MNTHIRHAWFPPTIPKRKHSLDAESEWPSAYHALSGPAPTKSPRPAKRLRGLEGGLAGLSLAHGQGQGVNGAVGGAGGGGAMMTINTWNLDGTDGSPASSAPVTGNQIHDAPWDGEAEPYISSIYEYASPHPGTTMSSAVSLPLQGEVCEASDEDEDGRGAWGREEGRPTFVNGQEGMPGYVVYEPEGGPGAEKRKRGDEVEMDEARAGKKKWYEPEKDRTSRRISSHIHPCIHDHIGIVVLDLDSSEDESTTRSPRRRRSAFSLSSSSSPSSPTSSQKEPGRPRSQTDADAAEYVISPALLSHLPPAHAVSSVVPILREDDPAKAIVLFRPAPWGTGAASLGEEGEIESQDSGAESVVDMEASPLMSDEDAMDVDS
jgi:hypothetical protein